MGVLEGEDTESLFPRDVTKLQEIALAELWGHWTLFELTEEADSFYRYDHGPAQLRESPERKTSLVEGQLRNMGETLTCVSDDEEENEERSSIARTASGNITKDLAFAEKLA